MEKLGLLIFDLDGTLFRTETVTIPAVRHCFSGRGLEVPLEEEIHSFFGRPAEEFHVWIRSFSTDDDPTDLADSISGRELELIREAGELYPGIHDLLMTFQTAGCQMAICSNGTSDYVPRVLKEHDLVRFFDSVSYRGDSGNDKPFMVRRLLEKMDGRPAIVVGDRRDDMEAAQQNGILSIGAGYGYGSPDELSSADAVADKPSDLARLVPRLLCD